MWVVMPILSRSCLGRAMHALLVLLGKSKAQWEVVSS
ncbi:hypothetical protein FBY03_12524 [Pseudomonas sp. SJZ079]|nr:hypothetical protein FBY03_12524 [Pseudomonas sp. SJZ079]